MDSQQFFPSKYLSAKTDVGLDKEFTLTIRNIVMENIGKEGDSETKPIVYFEKAEKGLVLNKTNNETLGMLFGYDTDAWIGKSIIVFSMMVQGPNGTVPGLRLRAITTPTPTQQPSMPAPSVAANTIDDFDDDIPF